MCHVANQVRGGGCGGGGGIFVQEEDNLEITS